ncbi:branched-chain amino acid ABC transporter substrate-binding protein [Herbaspirillum sp. YR522]|uniref:branched-chain amino acid ABC transporter substrate-binding protein n=1 Tax=Herbaspirillum sp. YR522 TaxID=1144342 RepID=UPI00026F9A2E|nr:branched-chain amino acid ABC transporter substrate-binding protein [Herbaspirillum sp. YR522]EJN00921.1 ABC-type branched-chain amino acid transport system, periplasmic component [Herbaspirillum sp. YR522]
MQPYVRLAMSLALAAVLSLHASAQVDAAEVTVAFAGPLEDPDALSAAQATQMAFDEINAQPARGGAQLKLMLQNDKGDPRTAEFVAHYLAKTDALAVIGHWTSTNSIAVAPIYTEAGLPQLAPIAWSKRFSALPGDNHFQGVGNNDIAMNQALQYLVPRLGVRRILIIDDRSILGAEMADAFDKYAQQAGLEILRQSVSNQTSDFNAPLMMARQKHPELILFTGIGAQTVTMVRSLKRLKLQAALLLTSPVVNTEFLQKTGLTDEVVYAIAPGAPVESAGRMEAFRKRYAERFRSEASSSAGFAYDLAYMFAAALRRSGEPDRRQLVRALREVSHDGVNQTIAFNPDGTLKHPIYTLYQATPQRWLVRRTVKASD